MKTEGFLIDMDGVILKNSLDLGARYIYEFINQLTPISYKTVKSFIRSFNSYPAREFMTFLFTSLGLQEHLPEFAHGVNNFEGTKGKRIKVDPYFEAFVSHCRKRGLKFKICSLAPVDRILKTLPYLKKKDIYPLSGKSKANQKTYQALGQELNIDLKKWIAVDDDPFALRSAKLNGLGTIMVLNKIFRKKEYKMYKDFIDFKARGFKEILKYMNNPK